MNIQESIKIGLLGILTFTVVYSTFIQNHSTKPEETHNHVANNASQELPQHQVNEEFSNPSDNEISNLPKTQMQFDKSEHDFGTVKQDSKNRYVFKFKNMGKEPLLISNARGSCGCTVPTYPKEPVAPGESGEIEVEYSPGKQQGSQVKTVTINANTEPVETVLKISAQVETN